jgi:hypothetical protein
MVFLEEGTYLLDQQGQPRRVALPLQIQIEDEHACGGVAELVWDLSLDQSRPHRIVLWGQIQGRRRLNGC